MISRRKVRQMWIFSFWMIFGCSVQFYITSIGVQWHRKTLNKPTMALIKTGHTKGKMGFWIFLFYLGWFSFLKSSFSARKYNGIIKHKKPAMALLKTDHTKGSMVLLIFCLFRMIFVC